MISTLGIESGIGVWYRPDAYLPKVRRWEKFGFHIREVTQVEKVMGPSKKTAQISSPKAKGGSSTTQYNTIQHDTVQYKPDLILCQAYLFSQSPTIWAEASPLG